ncbi:hypothetical protein ABK040_010895 [Willaertia magna]
MRKSISSLLCDGSAVISKTLFPIIKKNNSATCSVNNIITNSFINRNYAEVINKKVNLLKMKTEIVNNNRNESFKLNISEQNRKKVLKEIETLPEKITQEETQKRLHFERVTKFLARMGVCSKRQAIELIKKNEVMVNGNVINETGMKINPFVDVITVKGMQLKKKDMEKAVNELKLYIYHKPRGVLCSRVEHEKGKGRDTVYGKLRAMGFNHLISVGRLDYNTEGLLLLTNDGMLARNLELPTTGFERQYLVRVHGRVTQSLLDSLKKGSTIEGVHYGGMKAILQREGENSSWIKVILHEGKNREIRKIFQNLNLPVSRIIRIQFGPYKLENTQKGQLRLVELKEDLRKYCSPLHKLVEKSKEKGLESEMEETLNIRHREK